MFVLDLGSVLRLRLDMLFAQRRFSNRRSSCSRILYNLYRKTDLHRLYAYTIFIYEIIITQYQRSNTRSNFSNYTVRVECSANSLIVSLHYKNFNGRMFVAGFSEECGVNGRNQDVTTLVLPTSSDPQQTTKCGIRIARAVNDYRNRYFTYAMMGKIILAQAIVKCTKVKKAQLNPNHLSPLFEYILRTHNIRLSGRVKNVSYCGLVSTISSNDDARPVQQNVGICKEKEKKN